MVFLSFTWYSNVMVQLFTKSQDVKQLQHQSGRDEPIVPSSHLLISSTKFEGIQIELW